MVVCGCDFGCSMIVVSFRFCKVLWVVLVLNVLMFIVEFGVGIYLGLVFLLVDVIDFVGDVVNYGIFLVVLLMGLLWCLCVVLVKGFIMVGYGVFVIGKIIFSLVSGIVFEFFIMGVVVVFVLLVNGGVVVMFYVYCDGDVNMCLVWICSCNDVIGNVVVMLVVVGVVGMSSGWFDLIVVVIMVVFVLLGGIFVVRYVRVELGIFLVFVFFVVLIKVEFRCGVIFLSG